MTDAVLAVQTAFFEALAVPEMAALAPVFQHVPEDTEPPLVIIGGISVTPQGGKGDRFDQAVVEVLTAVRPNAATGTGTGREFLTPIMAKVRDLLDEQELPPQPGAVLSRPVFDGSEDALDEDGLTYVGTQRFSLFVQDA